MSAGSPMVRPLAAGGTPAPTKALLVGVIAVAAGLVGVTLGAGLGDRPRAAGLVLLALALLFLARVAGQVLVVLAAPDWLPPPRDWNLLPYRALLPIQLLVLAAMAAVVADFLRGGGDGPLATPRRDVGAAVVAFALVYLAAMAVRYAVRMIRRPAERGFGGTIPIVFHGVLAAFLVVYGAYNLEA